MATVFTTTQTDVVAPPTLPPIARDINTGNLWVLGQSGVNTLTLYRSTDSGGTWTSYAAFTHSTLEEWSRVVVDKNLYAHVAYRVNGGTEDVLYYRRVYLASGSPAWTSALRVSGAGDNGGVAGAAWQGVDLAVVRNSNGSYAIVVVGARTTGTTNYGIWAHGVSSDSVHGIYLNNGIIINNRSWLVSGTAPGRSGVTCEVEHNGDGFTSTTPHVWVSWGRTTLYMVKLAWQGSTVGWQGPSSSIIIKSNISAQNYAGGRYDGTRWLMPCISPDDVTTVRVYQRNQANTSTVSNDSPTHPTGNIRQFAVNFDNPTKNIRVYAVGTSTAVLYYVDFIRATSTWTSWATVTATAILGSAGNEWGVRASSSGNSRYDVITAASGSPNTISHIAQTINAVPNVATWNFDNVPYVNGAAADVAASLLLDWDFFDPDPGQTQGSYAVSRQIGAGTLNYWRASDSTWQTTEQQNSTSTTQLTLASSWASGSDANYTFKVKVWDSLGTPASGYSDALVIVPSTKVNPTITAPTAAQVLGVNSVTATWTVSEQTQYRVQLNVQGGGVEVYDSGWITDTATSFLVPYTLLNGTAWTLTLTTKNNEGLASTAQTVNFSVSYTPPAVPILTLTALPTLGVIRVATTNPAITGSQPAVLSQDIYRRIVANSVLNVNPYFETDLTDWTQVNATGTRSTVFAHQGIASCKVVPNGSSADCREESGTVAIDQTLSYMAEAFIRPDTANKPIKVYLNWYNGGAFISSTVASITSPVAGAWQYVTVFAPASSVPTANRASVSAGVGSTPAVTDVVYVDEVKLTVYNGDPGIRIASGLASNGVVDDWKTSALINYEYQCITTGVTGATVVGSWTQ